jgi:quinolinate synthase
MSEKHIVVQGATCKCKFSVEPKTDVLKVKSHTKHYANDKDASKKLIATDKEIGQTLEKNTFGKCKMQPTSSDFLPCQAVITKWSGFYEKTILSNDGKILLEDSKATCPIGGPDCISIDKHGQKAEPSKQNFKNANPKVHKQLNPLGSINNMNKKKLKNEGLEDSII